MRVSLLAGIGILGLALLGCKASSRAELSAACLHASEPAACVRLGVLLEQRIVPVLFPEEPGLYFALGCETGAPEACGRAEPWAKGYSDYEALETDVGCMLKSNAFACEELARNLRDDAPNSARAVELASSRLHRALSLYLAACANGDAASCLGAARIHRSGLGDPRDLPAADAEELNACALGLGLACEVAADHHAAKDALPLYQRACDLPPTLPRGCLKAAQTSEAVNAPAATISTSYHHACELLSTDACRWVSEHEPSLEAAPREASR